MWLLGRGRFRHSVGKKSLAHTCVAQGNVSIELRLRPMMQTLGIEHGAVGGIVVVHCGQSLRETTLDRWIKIRT